MRRRGILTATTLPAAAAAIGIGVTLAHAEACTADIDGNGLVNAGDLSKILSEWGDPCCGSDIDGSGTVDAGDISALLAQWQTLCPPTVETLVPNTGSIAGGETVVITGWHLASTTTVTIGGVALDVVSTAPGSIVVTAPEGSPGLADLVITAYGGEATVPNAFTIGLEWATVLEASPDPNVVIDPDLLDRIIDTNLAWRIRDNISQIEMLLVPPGTFMMGCSPSLTYGCGSAENPPHAVSLTQAFYLGRYEVTQAQWAAVMGVNPSYFSGNADSSARPVEQVTWLLADAFSTQCGLSLPTEAQWEHACRGGTATAFNDGSSDDAALGLLAWYDANNSPEGTKPVGLKHPNHLGFHDMHGNVWEWVSDWYDVQYYYNSPSIDPPGPPSSLGGTRVLRGGSWRNLSNTCRVSYRNAAAPSSIYYSYGLRVSRVPLQQEVCDNSRDDDGDGLVDCADPQCDGVKACLSAQDICGNGIDDDEDGFVDCEDSDCSTSAYCAELPWADVLEVLPDPAVVSDAELRSRILAVGLPWRVRDVASQIELVLVPPGAFTMGCVASQTECSPNESPVHEVTLTQPFYLGRYEVTQAEWVGVMGSNPSEFDTYPDSSSRPVEQVSWNMIQGFEAATGLRLPTEAEWEYACRAGTTTAFNNGSNDNGSGSAIAWHGYCCGGNSGGQTHPVGQKAPNRLGIHDMHGNVLEWVEDNYSSTYYSVSPGTDPTGPNGSLTRVLRGGNWNDFIGLARSSKRYDDSPNDRVMFGVGHGFRAARSPFD